MKKKLAVVCNASVPAIGGSTILLNNLLIEYPGEVHMITGFDKLGNEDPHLMPSYPVHRFTTKWPFINKLCYRFYNYFRPLLIRFIAKKLRKINAEAALAVYPTGYLVDCVYEACKMTGVKFWIHMHDLWEENTTEGTYEYNLAKSKEGMLLRNADKVFCMTDVQAEFYKAKYNIDPLILPHTVPTSKINSVIRKELSDKKTFDILYSGSVSPLMNLDALKTFVKAVDMLPPNYNVTMLVKYDDDYLKQRNLYSDRIQYKWLSTKEAFDLQKNSDLLFLPLSFKNCSIDEVNTVFATKTLDYFASGTPILVFSPPTSFHNISAHKNNWGHVVDRDDPTILSSEIVELCTNKSLQSRIMNGAQIEMQQRASDKYAKFLSEQL